MGIFGFQQSTGNSGPLDMYRGEVDVDGNPVYETTERSVYVVPTRGEYTLMVTGFSRPWEEEKKKEYQKEGQSPMTTKTNLELEIVEGRGKGKRFLWSFQTFSLACGDNPANIARVYMAAVLNGEKIPRGKQVFFEDIFRKPFLGYVVPSDTVNEQGKPKYASVSKDSIAPVPEPVEDEDDPFAEDVA